MNLYFTLLAPLVVMGCGSKNTDPLQHRAVYDFCDDVSASIAGAVEQYDAYAAKWETYDRESPEVKSEEAEISASIRGASEKQTVGWFEDRNRARRAEEGRRRSLPLGWTDRDDVMDRLRAELRFCVKVVRAPEDAQDAILGQIVHEGGKSGFSSPISNPRDVVNGLKELTVVAREVQARLQAVRGSDSQSKPSQ